MQNIALIGLGGIAQTVLNALQHSTRARVRQVIVRPGKVAQAQAALPDGVQAIDTLDQLDSCVTLVIETAGHAAVAQYAPAVLGLRRDFGLVSAGALADDTLRAALLSAARHAGRHILILSGAIGALDIIASARAAGLESMCYTGIKPANAWLGTPAAEQFDLTNLHDATVIFEGSAREVARAYPKNANVAATVALSGLGLDRTQVKLVAHPAVHTNLHRLEGQSRLGRFSFETEAMPSAANPKTSASTAFSIIAFLHGGPNALVLGDLP